MLAPGTGSSHHQVESIQALRALAALLVLWGHAGLAQWPRAESPWLIASSGAIGVDLFFVVSGFVMSMIHDTSPVTAGAFLQARLTRVLPLYLLATAAILLVVPATPVELWNSLLFVPVFDSLRYTNPVHWFGWTIGLELWFYVVFALAIALRARPKLVAAAALAVCAATSVASPSSAMWIKYLFNPMALEFVSGIVAWVLLPRLSRELGGLLLAGGACVAVGAALAFPELGLHRRILGDPGLALARAGAWGLPMFAVVLGAVTLERTGSIRLPRSIVQLGDASYSLYLLQPLLLLALRALSLADWRVAGLVFVTATPALALASRRHLEEPLTAWSRRVAGALAGPGSGPRTESSPPVLRRGLRLEPGQESSSSAGLRESSSPSSS